MTDQPPSSTERKAIARATTPDGNEQSLPTPATSGRNGGSRRTQLPTVTPRRFRKFFTPRSSLRRNVKVGSSRQALRDITSGDSNRRPLGRRRSSKIDEIQIFEDENTEALDSSRKRKRRLHHTPDPTPELSSPLKRCRRVSVVEPDSASEAENGSPGSSLDEYDSIRRPNPTNIRPIAPWEQNNLSGQRLLRECGGLSLTGGQVRLDYCNVESRGLLD